MRMREGAMLCCRARFAERCDGRLLAVCVVQQLDRTAASRFAMDFCCNSTSLCLSQSPALKIAVVIGATSEVQASLLPLCSAFETPRSRLDPPRGLALRRRVLLLVIEARLFGVQRRVRLVRRKAI